MTKKNQEDIWLPLSVYLRKSDFLTRSTDCCLHLLSWVRDAKDSGEYIFTSKQNIGRYLYLRLV
jgi:hypothetical protein